MSSGALSISFSSVAELIRDTQTSLLEMVKEFYERRPYRLLGEQIFSNNLICWETE